jgi:hypothetical protein
VDFSFIHSWNARIGEEETEGIEISGYDTLSRMYFTHSFDNQGNYVTYQANLHGGVWETLGE